MQRLLPAALTAILLSCGLLSCGKEKVVATPCRDDSACDSGYLCENYECIPAERKSCEVVIDGNPILQPSPYSAAFGDLMTPDKDMTITLHNLGTCTLTVFEASLAKGKDSSFTCDMCQGDFPIEIFPDRSKDVTLSLHATQVGQFDDELVILSDDKEFPELHVPIHANFLGVPQLRVTPNPVDFGYVAQGRLGKKTVQITNQGTGTAQLTVQSIALDPSDTQDFEIPTPPTTPMVMSPIKIDNKAIISFELDYHPRSVAQHQVNLVVTTDLGVTTIPVEGNAQTPPAFSFSPTSIQLGDIPLGTTNHLPLTLVNQGGAPLTVKLAWGGTNPSTDLYTVPQQVPPILPGQYVEIQVAATPTATGPLSGLLVMTTNDPANPTATVSVTANGVPATGAQVVKVEMGYANGSSGTFDNDVRDVALNLEHPYGYVCNKQDPHPTNWAPYGNPFWLSFPPKDNPQRIVLADSQHDGTYRVMVQYMEDCSSIPTGLLAGLLGISIDVLVDYLTGGVAQLDPQQVSDMIAKVCLSHSSTSVTVKVFVNGTEIKEATTSLGKKGDSAYVIDLKRTNGVFTAQ